MAERKKKSRDDEKLEKEEAGAELEPEVELEEEEKAKEEQKQKGDEEAAAEVVEEEPIPDEPDNQDAIRVLKELGARLDVNQHGFVWRVFLYEKNGDDAARQIHGFPMLKEIWLLGSKVTGPMAEKLQEDFPAAKIFA